MAPTPDRTDEPRLALALIEENDPESYSDAVLVGRYRDGDECAFTELYRRYATSVRAVCRHRLRDPELAEEAVQETFARAVRGLRSFEGPDVGRWLRRVAKNHCIDLLRRSGRETSLPEETAGTRSLLTDRAADVALERVIARAAVADLLNPLDARDQQLLLSHHVEGVPVGELATVWSMTPGAMGVALHRARRRARAQVGGGNRVSLGAMPPLVLWFRERFAAVERWVHGGEAAGAGLHALAHVVVATALLGSGMLAALPAGASELSDATSSTAVPVVEPSPSAPGVLDPGVPTAPRNTDGAADDPSVPAVAAPVPERAAPDATDDGNLATVAVPGTDRRITRDAPDDPQTRIAAEISVEEAAPVYVAVESHDMPATAPVEDVGCEGAQAVGTVVSCEQSD